MKPFSWRKVIDFNSPGEVSLIGRTIYLSIGGNRMSRKEVAWARGSEGASYRQEECASVGASRLMAVLRPGHRPRPRVQN